MSRIKVQDEQHLVRDETTNAILSLDYEALSTSRRARRLVKQKDEQLQSLEERVSKLEALLNKL